MSPLRLVLRTAPGVPLDASAVRPDALAGLRNAEVERLPLRHGHELASLGDFFSVEGSGGDEVHVLGDVSRVLGLGSGMRGGELRILGNAGRHTGARMAGGRLRVDGDSGDWTGAEMSGGVLEVRGDAGASLGGAYAGASRGMRGGALLGHGSAGERAGERMRRGTLAVAGGAGAWAGAHMVAGTLLVCGDLGRGPGIGMKRGTLVAGGALQLLPTFRYACTDRPGFLALLFRSLEAMGFHLRAPFHAGAFRRYAGDCADLGRGEILQWTSQEP